MKRLAELCRQRTRMESWRVRLMPEGDESVLAPAALAGIDDKQQAIALTVTGLDQRGLERLVERHARRLRGIWFFKCPRLADLSPLERLPQLTHVGFFWNQRATRLWDFARTPRLRGLSLLGFTRLHRLDDLRAATSLTELELGSGNWPSLVLHSLAPLADLRGLRSLSIEAKRIERDGCAPLAQLRELTHLDFPPTQFTTEEIAWLRARLPLATRGRSLRAVMAPPPKALGSLLGDKVFPVGRGKGMLDRTRHRERIARHVAAFAAMVARFRADPSARPQ